jgi:hypothetical protein
MFVNLIAVTHGPDNFAAPSLVRPDTAEKLFGVLRCCKGVTSGLVLLGGSSARKLGPFASCAAYADDFPCNVIHRTNVLYRVSDDWREFLVRSELK